jgi:hypothetical protein
MLIRSCYSQNYVIVNTNDARLLDLYSWHTLIRLQKNVLLLMLYNDDLRLDLVNK